MIYIDPTEARALLHQSLKDTATPLDGLEEMTGADILIADDGIVGPVNRAPGSILLRTRMGGAMLIQRKHGHDLVASIQSPGLLSILLRMQEHSGATAWLATIGDYHANHEGNLVINGVPTGFSANSLYGAIMHWQLAGGYYHQFMSEYDLALFCQFWDNNRARVLGKEVKVIPRQDEISVGWDERPWKSTLKSFPGIGAVAAENIADYCNTLAFALAFLSTDNVEVHGIGPETKKKTRGWLGLDSDQELHVILKGEKDDGKEG